MHSTAQTVDESNASRMPEGIPFIIANEFAERFCYYGINAILAVYMTGTLHFGQARATSWQSLFKAGADDGDRDAAVFRGAKALRGGAARRPAMAARCRVHRRTETDRAPAGGVSVRRRILGAMGSEQRPDLDPAGHFRSDGQESGVGPDPAALADSSRQRIADPRHGAYLYLRHLSGLQPPVQRDAAAQDWRRPVSRRRLLPDRELDRGAYPGRAQRVGLLAAAGLRRVDRLGSTGVDHRP